MTTVTEQDLRDARGLDAGLPDAVRGVLERELRDRGVELRRIAPETTELLDLLSVFLEGGKLLRPRFCFWGGAAVRIPDPADAARLAGLGAAIELVQAAALLHDDVMDHALTRRGRPAVHVAAAARHAELGLSGDGDDHGRAVAIILGDLSLAWAGALVSSTLRGVPEATAAATRAEFDRLCTEVMSGQYLDMLHQSGGYATAPDPSTAALSVIRWKTVPYTVLRPLRMGAALLGASEEQLDVLDDYAIAVGTAFQLRDDLLGVVGDETTTGKTSSGDIQEGKRTVLLALARERADETQRAVLDGALGRPDATPSEIDAVREVLRATGALGSVADLVEEGRDEALRVLGATDLLTGTSRGALAALARATTDLDGLPVR